MPLFSESPAFLSPPPLCASRCWDPSDCNTADLLHLLVCPFPLRVGHNDHIVSTTTVEMGRNGPLGSFRALDAFSRPLEDVRIRSSSGAILTLVSFLLISVLTLSSFLDYRRVQLSHNLEVDKSRGEKLAVSVNITFPKVPCYRR